MDSPRNRTTFVGTLRVLAGFLVAVSALTLVVAALWSFRGHPKAQSGGASEGLKGEVARAAAAASATTVPQSLRVEDSTFSALGPKTLAIFGTVGLLGGVLGVFFLRRWRRRELGVFDGESEP
jgi:hypothetical protein